MLLAKAARIADRAHGRDNHFNLIRMIAASGVLVSHAWPIALGPSAVEPLKPFLGITLGRVCVYVFFAISGFFIAKSFDRNVNRRRFLEARALRLFPALAVVLILTVLIAGLFVTTAPAAVFWADVPNYLLRNLTLIFLDYDLPGVFEAMPYGPTINGSLWTLFYEVICYAGIFLAGVCGLLRAPRLFAMGFGLVVLTCLVLPLLPGAPGRLMALAGLALPFAVGSAFYVWRFYMPLHWALALGLAGMAWLSLGTALFTPAFALALCYWVFWLGLGQWPAPLAYNRLGDYSYGVYIYAFPLQQLAAFHGALTPLANIAVAAPFTLVCAVLSWHLIEKPALSFVRLEKPADLAVKKGVS